MYCTLHEQTTFTSSPQKRMFVCCGSMPQHNYDVQICSWTTLFLYAPNTALSCWWEIWRTSSSISLLIHNTVVESPKYAYESTSWKHNSTSWKRNSITRHRGRNSTLRYSATRMACAHLSTAHITYCDFHVQPNTHTDSFEDSLCAHLLCDALQSGRVDWDRECVIVRLAHEPTHIQTHSHDHEQINHVAEWDITIDGARFEWRKVG